MVDTKEDAKDELMAGWKDDETVEWKDSSKGDEMALGRVGGTDVLKADQRGGM